MKRKIHNSFNRGLGVAVSFLLLFQSISLDQNAAGPSHPKIQDKLSAPSFVIPSSDFGQIHSKELFHVPQSCLITFLKASKSWYFSSADMSYLFRLFLRKGGTRAISAVAINDPNIHEPENFLIYSLANPKLTLEFYRSKQIYQCFLVYFKSGSPLAKKLNKENGWVLCVVPESPISMPAARVTSYSRFVEFLSENATLDGEDIEDYFEINKRKKSGRPIEERRITEEDILKIPKETQEELKLFIAASEVNPSHREAVEIAFNRWLLGKSTLSEILADLTELGIEEDPAKLLVRKYLMLKKNDEVTDPRPQITFEDRVQLLEQKTPFLSKIGKAYLAKLKQALASGDSEQIERLKRDFPSVENPHLEYFTPLMNAHAAFAYLQWSSALRIVQGCSHSCRHCFFKTSHTVRYMPFYRIVGLLKAAKEESEGKDFFASTEGSICLYRDSEMMDYYDPLFDADCGDVIAAILKYFPEQKNHITTRGWYLGDKIAPRAARKIVSLLNTRFVNGFRLSVDLFDIQRDPVRYICRVAEILDAFSSNETIELTVCSDPANKEETRIVSELIRMLTFNPNVSYYLDEPIFLTSKQGRGAKLTSEETFDVGDCMWEIQVLPDGSVVCNMKYLRERYRSEEEWADIIRRFEERRIKTLDSFRSDRVIRFFADETVSFWSAEETGVAIVPKKAAKSPADRKFLESILIKNQSPFASDPSDSALSQASQIPFEIAL